MPLKYALLIKPETYDLVVFLNNSEHPKYNKNKIAYLVFDVNNASHVITAEIKYEDDLYENGVAKEPMTFLL
jgi:hypothetical protein